MLKENHWLSLEPTVSASWLFRSEETLSKTWHFHTDTCAGSITFRVWKSDKWAWIMTELWLSRTHRRSHSKSVSQIISSTLYSQETTNPRFQRMAYTLLCSQFLMCCILFVVCVALLLMQIILKSRYAQTTNHKANYEPSDKHNYGSQNNKSWSHTLSHIRSFSLQ